MVQRGGDRPVHGRAVHAQVADGTVDGANLLLWIVLMAIPAGLLFAGNHFWVKQRSGLACLLLAIPAAPALFFGLFVLLFIILQPDMR